MVYGIHKMYLFQIYKNYKEQLHFINPGLRYASNSKDAKKNFTQSGKGAKRQKKLCSLAP